jgi:hypothetical protein
LNAPPQLKPHAQFSAEAKAEAEARFARWMKWLVIGGALVGGAIGGFGYKELLGVIIGAVIGALLGGLIHRILVHTNAASAADQAYLKAWCAHHGMTVMGASPANGPYADSGHRQRTGIAVQGPLGGMNTLFYNFSYWTKSGSGKNESETEHQFKIMRLTGVELPIARLTIHERGFLNRFSAIDKLQGAMTAERPISLESVAFNEKYDLTISDDADEIWIRRIFDPATIAAVIEGRMHIPDLRYYDRAWWWIEPDHLDVAALDMILKWQADAAEAVRHLARVPNL